MVGTRRCGRDGYFGAVSAVGLAGEEASAAGERLERAVQSNESTMLDHKARDGVRKWGWLLKNGAGGGGSERRVRGRSSERMHGADEGCMVRCVGRDA